MSGLGVIILVILVASILFGARKWALLGVMASVLYLTKGLVFDVGGVTLYAYRVVILAAFTRVVFRGEFQLDKLNALDYSVFFAYGYTALIFLIRTASGYGTSVDIHLVSTMDKIGLFVDISLGYFAIRGLIGTLDDIRWALVRFVVLLIPYVVLLCVERWTGQNPFGAIGGVPTVWSEGARIRCQGSFVHPSLLGTLGASLLPIFGALMFSREGRGSAAMGLLLSGAIVLLANSGGPLTMAAVECAALCLWPLRHRMAAVRYSILAAFVLLAFAMRAPIWYLPDRISSLVGGDGWHRSYLMQMAFNHLDQWWLAGMPLDLTRDWFPYLVMGAVDLTNFYLTLGFDAGLLAIALFFVIFVRGFALVGSAHKSYGWLAWGLGAALAGHLANFLAITYFDQMNLVWLFQLAAISSLAVRSQVAEGGARLAARRSFGPPRHPVSEVRKFHPMDPRSH